VKSPFFNIIFQTALTKSLVILLNQRYVGTIMHSLDHCLLDWNIEDPLWLDDNHPEYGKMAQLGRIVKVGFTSDLPGLLIHRRYKGSGHPFYEKIYAKAATINVQLADCMDTCIVK
jgi:hypothetical protein